MRRPKEDWSAELAKHLDELAEEQMDTKPPPEAVGQRARTQGRPTRKIIRFSPTECGTGCQCDVGEPEDQKDEQEAEEQ